MTGNRRGWFDGTNKVDGTNRMDLFKRWNVICRGQSLNLSGTVPNLSGTGTT